MSFEWAGFPAVASVWPDYVRLGGGYGREALGVPVHTSGPLDIRYPVSPPALPDQPMCATDKLRLTAGDLRGARECRSIADAGLRPILCRRLPH